VKISLDFLSFFWYKNFPKKFLGSEFFFEKIFAIEKVLQKIRDFFRAKIQNDVFL